MLSDEQTKRVGSKLFLVQIAAAAMMFSIVILVPVMCMIAQWETLTGTAKLLTMIASLAAICMYLMSAFVPKIFSTQPPAGLSDDAAVDSVLGMLSTETLIRFALIEGAAFMNLLVFMVEPHMASLIAAGIGFLMMLIFFPRKSKMISAIEASLPRQSD